MGEEKKKPPVEEMTLGCAFSIFCFGAVFLVIVMLITGGFDDIDWDSDSDCNDRFIEQDYNGDGEEDAEDFRIQTEGC